MADYRVKLNDIRAAVDALRDRCLYAGNDTDQSYLTACLDGILIATNAIETTIERLDNPTEPDPNKLFVVVLSPDRHPNIYADARGRIHLFETLELATEMANLIGGDFQVCKLDPQFGSLPNGS